MIVGIAQSRSILHEQLSQQTKSLSLTVEGLGQKEVGCGERSCWVKGRKERSEAQYPFLQV